MNEYHKIKTIFKRDPYTKFKTLLIGEFSMPEFEYLKNNAWVWAEKVDGTNIRIMFDGTNVTFGGKTDRAQIPKPLMQDLNDIFIPMQPIFEANFSSKGVCLYGEGYGAGIQEGGKYRQDQSFVLFDVKIGNWWLQRKDVEGIANMLNIGVVPIIGKGTLDRMVEFTEKGFTSMWGNFTAEGIVARPEIELKTRSGERIITKIKHKDFVDIS
jgi:hypothetical protein